MSRSSPLDKHSQAEKLFFTEDDLRFATPEIVAEYRAKRLSCNTLVDIGCSIGFQTLSFARHCKHVIGIERDAEKIKKAQLNAEVLGLKNITFIHGDALDSAIVEKVKHADIFFCDPYRPPTEDSRKIESIEPDIRQLIATYLPLKNALAIEFPPQLREIPFDAEKEYISVHGLINRLTLYFGTLKKSETSAVVLPQEKVLRRTPDERRQTTDDSRLPTTHYPLPTTNSFIYEIDAAIVAAGLTEQLITVTKTELLSQEKYTFVTGKKEIKSPFFRNAYRVLATATTEEKRQTTDDGRTPADGRRQTTKNERESTDNIIYGQLKEVLNHVNAGRVKIRFSIPAEEYNSTKREIEKELRGKKDVVVLKFGEVFVVGE